ncbi:hypothetical protein LSAT2_002523, partial [Lamellibrachia satsuma]
VGIKEASGNRYFPLLRRYLSRCIWFSCFLIDIDEDVDSDGTSVFDSGNNCIAIGLNIATVGGGIVVRPMDKKLAVHKYHGMPNMDYDFSAIMSKLLAALVGLSVAYAVQGCGLDSCKGQQIGIPINSLCGPCNYYYRCNGGPPVYDWCPLSNNCIINGVCGLCGDTCAGKCDGKYQSVNRGRPYYYSCHAGQLFYEECQPFMIFNPWIQECECYEGVCLQGNGWKISFCRGKGWRVNCLGGFPVAYQRCPRPRPYVCCRTYQCVSSCNAYNGPNLCCNN